jgi:hypothetical protein
MLAFVFWKQAKVLIDNRLLCFSPCSGDVGWAIMAYNAKLVKRDVRLLVYFPGNSDTVAVAGF